jgi:hypothetical protein
MKTKGKRIKLRRNTTMTFQKILPSELKDPKTYEQLDPDWIITYLLENGWKLTYEQVPSRVLWFAHPQTYAWPTDDPQSIFAIPNAIESYFWKDFDNVWHLKSGALIRVLTKLMRTDYAKNNKRILHDLEHHENRWKGHILEDLWRTP